MNVAVELWHLIVGGAAGLSAICFLFMRLQAITSKFKNDAVEEALRRQKVEARLQLLEDRYLKLEEKDSALMDMINRVYDNVSTMRSESTQQHADMREFVRNKFDEIRKDFSTRNKEMHERINKIDHGS